MGHSGNTASGRCGCEEIMSILAMSRMPLSARREWFAWLPTDFQDCDPCFSSICRFPLGTEVPLHVRKL